MENKSKILYLYKILHEKTDEENMLSTNDIIAELKKINIETSRKTVASDITLLEEFGVDVITIRSSQNLYYIGNRQFELPEIKILIDAVESSKLLTNKKSDVLISKLLSLMSDEQSAKFKEHIFTEERIKPTNENIYYNIDKIQQAIINKKEISFLYSDYDINKNIIYRHDGYQYFMSPYELVWNDDHYYVVGYSNKYNDIGQFRVDRLEKVECSGGNYTPPKESFNINTYLNTSFKMYSGEKTLVTLKCTNDMMRAIIDKFGEDIETEKIDDESFTAKVQIATSPTFYSWLFGFGEKIIITSPLETKKKYIEMLRASLEKNLI